MIKKHYGEKDLITLKEYLNDEISKGPNANSGSIDYHYQHYDNIYNYFYITFLNIQQFKILCIPNFILEYNDYVVRTALAYDLKLSKLHMAKKMKSSINKCDKCRKQKKARFIFFTFIIMPDEKEEITHANIIVIDLIKKTIERFEPFGHTSSNKKILEQIDELFKNKILGKLDLDDYSYISPSKISPRLGIQYKADSYNGMCITISMMYLHLRILNPDIKQRKIVNYLLKKSKKKLKEMILKYAKHIEFTLKENKKIILELFEDINSFIFN